MIAVACFYHASGATTSFHVRGRSRTDCVNRAREYAQKIYSLERSPDPVERIELSRHEDDEPFDEVVLREHAED